MVFNNILQHNIGVYYSVGTTIIITSITKYKMCTIPRYWFKGIVCATDKDHCPMNKQRTKIVSSSSKSKQLHTQTMPSQSNFADEYCMITGLSSIRQLNGLWIFTTFYYLHLGLYSAELNSPEYCFNFVNFPVIILPPLTIRSKDIMLMMNKIKFFIYCACRFYYSQNLSHSLL